MSTTTIPTPNPITNLVSGINRLDYIDQFQINNVIGAFLNDVAFILTNQYGIKTGARRANDESFNLQDFANTDDYELLITYFSSDMDWKINHCKSRQFQVEYDLYYRIEGKSNNKSRLEEVLGVVDQLLCDNGNNANYWEYIFGNPNQTHKKFIMWLYGINQLKFQNCNYQEVQSKNYYLAKQTYNLQLSYSIIPKTI